MKQAIIQPITIVHEVQGRIRLRSRVIGSLDLDPDYFEAGLESIPGVMAVRLNSRAASVVIRYDCRDVTRNAILAYLADLPGKAMSGHGVARTLQIGRAHV